MNRSSFASADTETFGHRAIEVFVPLAERKLFAVRSFAVASIARKSVGRHSIALNSLKPPGFAVGHLIRSPHAVHHFVLCSSDDPFRCRLFITPPPSSFLPSFRCRLRCSSYSFISINSECSC